ncbi:hypothetical protein BSU04_04040 [Caballeronia sordidicola]|uniref:Uncharacterized protein n=1 Tax=Caballeronia sordidicola TaxID=196367 RepID=A0A226X915_CABSO|nr:hypothetical protein BSU04_04040 [Caballeronia sordidicola]
MALFIVEMALVLSGRDSGSAVGPSRQSTALRFRVYRV